ncbi:MAG: PspA/IM30 family protein [Gammaproteobacteria bacterium]
MSSVFDKLWTALRGGVREIGDAVVDANGIRIFEQEIKDAQANIATAKKSLTEVMARKMQAARKVDELAQSIRQNEGYAEKALEQNNETLALDVAGKIAQMENDRNEQLAIVTRLEGQIEQLKTHIKNAEKLIADHERELALVRTTESVQKATEQVVENVAANNSALNSARDSLERIKKRQEMKQDRMAAGDILAAELSDGGLDAKLEAAGIKGTKADASAILARIKANKAG